MAKKKLVVKPVLLIRDYDTGDGTKTRNKADCQRCCYGLCTVESAYICSQYCHHSEFLSNYLPFALPQGVVQTSSTGSGGPQQW